MGATNPLYTPASAAEPAVEELTVDIVDSVQPTVQPGSATRVEVAKKESQLLDVGAHNIPGAAGICNEKDAVESGGGKGVTEQLAIMAQAAANFRAMTANRQRNG